MSVILKKFIGFKTKSVALYLWFIVGYSNSGKKKYQMRSKVTLFFQQTFSRQCKAQMSQKISSLWPFEFNELFRRPGWMY